MQYETIDTHHAFELFYDLMSPDNDFRVLHLVGEAKMGKSHLLTKVFPSVAQKKYQARCVTLDLRNRLYSVPDILQMACVLIGTKDCISYSKAYQEWINWSMRRSKVELRGINALFSFLRVSVQNTVDDIHEKELDLTSKFVDDVGRLDDRIFLLLFDSVNNANEYIQTWLMDALLVQVLRFPHVRVVIASRSVHEAHGSYAALYRTCQLQPVTDDKEYIEYCRKLNIVLVEQSIHDLAYCCDYSPGAFTDLVLPKLWKQRLPNG